MTIIDFCKHIQIQNMSKFEATKHIIWYHTIYCSHKSITIKLINEYHEIMHLNKWNVTALRDNLNSSRETVSNSPKEYNLSFGAREVLNNKYAELLLSKNEHLQEIKVEERANIEGTPFLSVDDLADARKMAELYLILHCFENSVRNFISSILEKEIGEQWWDSVKNAELEKRYRERSEKEQKQRWVSTRGTASPLFYLDWGDLVKIIRKEFAHFNKSLPDIKFVELRMDDLERLRNIIAHNGKLPSDNDIDRIVVHFKDWCKQLESIN